MNKLTEWLTKPFLEEDINIPVNVGDTILVGKFKNKKMVVKDIGVDDHGMPTINGRKATTFRMGKKVNIFDKEEIKEGVNDPGIFKVVFLAGGPGSGKTFVSRQLFGMPDSVNISMSGMKMVNSDKELKYLLNKYGFGTDLDNMPDELFRQLTDPTYKDYSGLRDYSKELTTQRMKQYRDGRLGMIIDGTGHKWKIVRKQKQELEKLGYDTYMIFVDTTLEVAQKRNQERDRILPPKLLEDSWKGVQKNRGAFKSLFKNNFIEIQNNETLNDKQIEKKFGSLARKYINVFMKRPIKNKIAKSWIKKQQILKKQGIKEFDIPSPSRKAVKKNKTNKMSGYKKVNEQKSKIKKVVGIYGGRFQPFGPHHKKTYEWLKKQVDEAYIVTSNLKSLPRHPMNFKEKVRHMVKMGIPKNRIIKETSPYKAVNTLKKFDEDTTAVIYIFGKKDAGRLKGGKYFDDYKKNKNKMTGYRDRGYILTAPHVSVSVGGKEISGTTMRQLLGSPEYEKNREKLFKKAFGYFDKGIYTMMNNKFKKLFESLDDFLINNDMNKIIKEGSITVGSPVDDGPATFHKGFSDYKSNAGDWIKSMYKDTGWELVQYILGKHAVNPDYDYTLKYTIVPAVSYQSQGKYKKHIEDKVLKNLGYEVIKWMGISDKGVDPKSPALPGADGDTENTDLKERINLDEEVQLILEVDRMTLEEGVKFNNFLKDWSKTAKQPLDKVRKTMMNKNTFSIAKLNDFSVEKVFDSAKKGYKRASVVFHYLPDKLADKIQNTKVMKKKDEYLKQADEFLQKHPKTKKVVMLGAAATVTYMWTQMTFVGEPDYDFDLSGVAGAAVGAKNLKDLFGGTEGAKFLTLFATGKAMGLTIPYPGKTIAKFAVGITYGARKLYKQKKAQKADAEKKTKTTAPDTVKNPNPKGRKKTVSRKSAVQWVAKTKGTKAAKKYASSLSERINLDEEVKLILEDDTVKYKKPNFEFEWDEAKRYPEFVEMGKDGWIELVKKGYTTKYSKIKDILGNVDLNFDGLEKEKKARFQSTYENGTIEIPTVVKFSDKDYDLIGGNTRLSGLVSNGVNPTLWVVDISNLKELAEGLLLEGGAYGHMNHPFDDKNITFSDLKQIIINGLGGKLNREDGVTEKLDGQNLMISWVNGKLVTARNKGQLKNFGSSAMDIKGVASKFSGRGDIRDAFVFAMKDLNKSIGSLSDKQKEKIFGNGKNWMNLEVMYPKSANVIDYDKADCISWNIRI